MYNYFVSFASETNKSTGMHHRVISFKLKPTFSELMEGIEKNNPQYGNIALINFKLITNELAKN